MTILTGSTVTLASKRAWERRRAIAIAVLKTPITPTMANAKTNRTCMTLFGQT
jgi:hypothetical protein